MDSWGLVIATYKRHDILRRCLRAALKQSVLPAEIIVVDSSPNFDEIAANFRREFAHAAIRYIYEKGKNASLTAQRNQGIALSSAPILFLIDDDSLMYEDCAEEILKVYEYDPHHSLAGVSAMGVPVPPDEVTLDSSASSSVREPQRQSSARSSVAKAVRKFAGKIFRTEATHFVPYDREFPELPIAPEIPANTIGRIQVMAGYAMTFRRSVLLAEPFEEALQRYAAGEDQDASYRISRHGALVNAVRARLCHVQAQSGRLSPFVVMVLANLNPVFLHRKYSTDLSLSRRRLLLNMSHRLVIVGLKECVGSSWRFPLTRGVAYAMLRFNDIWKRDLESLRTWYPAFQSEVIGRAVLS